MEGKIRFSSDDVIIDRLRESDKKELSDFSCGMKNEKDKEGLKEEIGYFANDGYKYILENQNSFVLTHMMQREECI